MSLAERFEAAWAELEPIGRRPDGGYDRFSWTDIDLELRGWFRRQAEARGLVVDQDRNANLWAWWGAQSPGTRDPGRGAAVAVGSHLDSVPRGGAFDGPLGVVSGFFCVDELRARHGDTPPRPLAVVAFSEEEGARFGVACLGSRLLTGTIDPDRARSLTDASGTTLASAMAAAGADPASIGPDAERLERLGCYVELHVEQGRGLDGLGAAVGVATGIWPHGRWHIRFEGEANHAGTARFEDRRDPTLPFAATVTGARATAAAKGGLATVGRAHVEPNATNAVAASVDAWLDARAPKDATLDAIVAEITARAEAAAADHGVGCVVVEESRSPAVVFDETLRHRMRDALGDAPELATGAGHDAGILAATIPTGMLFVRNPTGVSHSPAEHAALSDCVEGVQALVTVLESVLHVGAA